MVLIHPVLGGLKFSWPLFPRFVNYDMKTSSYVGLPKCSAKGPMHPKVGYESMRMLGQSSSMTSKAHVDLEVIDSKKYSSFSILTFVYVTNDEGNVFEMFPSYPDSLYGYMGVFYNTTDVVFQVKYPNMSSFVTVASGIPLTKKEWMTVAVTYDHGNDEICLFVGVNVTGPIVIPYELSIYFPALIRLGGGFSPGTLDASGLVTCLNVYDSDIQISDVPSALDFCHRINWSSQFLDALGTISVGTCSNHTGHFLLVSKDMLPESRSPVLSEYVTGSRLRCATWCSRNTSCLSFGLTYSTQRCILYMEDESFALDEEPGSDYYIKSYLTDCC